MRQTILRMTRTTAGNYNISIDLLGRIRIPVPDSRLQQRFCVVITRTLEMLNTTDVSARTSMDLFVSFLDRLLRNDVPPCGTPARRPSSGGRAAGDPRGTAG